MNRLFPIVFLSLSIVLVAGCGTAKRGEPFAGKAKIESPESARGQVSFMKHCHECHPGGEGGLGPALNNKPLPGFMMRFQIRNGLGAMPSFSSAILSDREIDEIIAYLKDVRRAGVKPGSPE